MLSSPSSFTRKTLTCVPLLLICLVAPCVAKVLDLETLTIDKYLDRTSEKPMLLEIMAYWCGHCQRFAPYYEQVAMQLHDQAIVAKVDGSLNRVQSLRFRVAGFPTFYLIYKGKVVVYNGPRSVDGLVRFVESRGEETSKPHNYFIGPLGPYWKAVGFVFRTVNDAYERIEDAQLSSWTLWAIGAGAIVALLSLFLLIIHVITKPSPPRPARESRPHAD